MNKQDMGYEVVLADTEESKKIHYNLRYQVYCLEKGFEEASNFTDEEEKDEYDERGVHFLIRRKGSAQWAGTFRLIVSKLESLPIYHHAQLSDSFHSVSDEVYAEFSRLAIIRQFQAHSGEVPKVPDDPDLCMVFRAICTGIEYSRSLGTKGVVFLCRRSLARVINGMGIKCPQIGEKAIFRGIRYPYEFDLSNFPLRLFETPKSLQGFTRGNSYTRYSQLAIYEDSQRSAVAA